MEPEKVYGTFGPWAIGRLNPDWVGEMEERRRRARLDKTCANCGRHRPNRRALYCEEWYCSDAFFVYYYGLPWDWIRREIFIRDDYTCQKCGWKLPGPYHDGLECDHIVERHQGGSDLASNLQTLCHACHVEKTTMFLRKLRPQQAIEREKERHTSLENF